MMTKNPLISIVTATYNAGLLLEKTIQSIRAQQYAEIEYIVIDGASTDNTLGIIDKYKDLIKYSISEPDKGIYDAWNKGVKAAKGEWISFLGAGDEYLPDAIFNYVEYINKNNNSELEFLSSKVDIVKNDGSRLYTIGSEWMWPKFLDYMNIAHVGSLHSKRLFDKYGLYDIKYKLVGDYELLLRAGPNLMAGYLPNTTATMLFGGMSISKASLKEAFKAKASTGLISKTRLYLKYNFSLMKANLRFFLYKIGFYVNIRK